MQDHRVDRGGLSIHARISGSEDANAPTVVFANSLGTDLRIWDDVVAHLPETLRIVRFDKRGHGLSSVPPAPYAMGALVTDAEAVCDELDVRDCVFVGLSIGGLIAQGLAVKRMDIVRAMVLSNTAAKIGTPSLWEARIEAVKAHGMDNLADGVMERWFSRRFRESDDLATWRQHLIDCPPEGYIGCCAAISGTDFYSSTASLRLPTLVIAGSEDKATPPDLVRETADLIPGARFELMRGSGHLPCIEHPQDYADLLTGFLKEIGHV
ncbi:3-oxoadipate enol-lactonase [Pelagovum pacificum]|uniref:3-oxoadipate enol-lactonase n=1 Tax=Pelagovum pacificum TaxID=2588711 RepID=A0A5C5GF48_9RHOB|nr:3-oxoadipate enol-lactonase [Pelagovum pacificum]QQA43481.1 3-oxoadipate enol-lactonase [Pelagovum pacificum]TNY33382.1 3-oxoadipate enol-lactonase [Pelagovum pacificum]